MSLPFGPSNVTCLLAISTATILPWTVSTVSAAIPPSGAALVGAAVSAGMLAGGELWVLPHPAITIANTANNDNWSIAPFLMKSFPRARVFPGLFVCRKPRSRPEPLALLVILTKRATRADGRISDSGAQAPPVPVLSSASDKNQDRCAISKTGTGFADAKLCEILPSARVARFVRMTEKDACTCLPQDDAKRSLRVPCER